MTSTPRPYNLIAELTYRCPLRCAYCSNPLRFDEVDDALSAADWARVFTQAASLGAVHVGLTGGEPMARADLDEIVAAAAEAGLYPHLVTAGTARRSLERLQRAGLRSVQLSLQDVTREGSSEIAGVDLLEEKLAFAAEVRRLGLAFTLNVVLHRRNLARVPEVVARARELGADRLELANVQYHGWALRNRDALLPSREQLDEATRAVERARRESEKPEILFALPDYFRDRPKPCMGGWGRRMIVVAPDGRVLPCHAAAELPDLEFWTFPEHDLEACWSDAPGMNAFRGEDWMQAPCRTCPERTRDFGGCRCQAFALTGDASATDPACALAPERPTIAAAHATAARSEDAALVLRGLR